jgi:CRISPR-associated protein Cmr2
LIKVKNKDNELENFLHSIHHKLDTYKTIINEIGDKRDKLENFFENYFNEKEHQKYKKFFEELVEFMNLVYKNEEFSNEEKFNLIYSTLRFIKFVNKGDKK